MEAPDGIAARQQASRERLQNRRARREKAAAGVEGSR